MIRSLHFKCIDLINDFITFFWYEHTNKLKIKYIDTNNIVFDGDVEEGIFM